MKNKKEIDMIVEELKPYLIADKNRDLSLSRAFMTFRPQLKRKKEVANLILTKLKENEIVLDRKKIIEILESDEVQQEIIVAIVQSRNTIWTNKEFARAITNRIYNGIRNFKERQKYNPKGGGER